MKKHLIILLIALLGTLSAGAESAFFKKCDNLDGVTTVYISKTMMRFAKNMNLGDGDVNLSSIASKVDEIEIVNTEAPKAVKTLKKLANDSFAGAGYENLVRVNDDGERTSIMYKTVGKNNEFVIVADEGSEFSVITIRGPLSVDDITAAVQ